MITKHFPRQVLRDGSPRVESARRRYTALHHEETENGTAEAMDFRIVGRISGIERIAAGKGIRDLRRLNRTHGRGRWRKLKGLALVRDRTTGEVYRRGQV